jgi:Fic family protein
VDGLPLLIRLAMAHEQSRLRNELVATRASLTVVRLAELLFARPFVTANRLARDLQVTLPTAQAAINDLERRGVLQETTGRERGRVYFAPGIFEAVYGDAQ